MIGLVSIALLTCCVLVTVATCVIWYLRKKKKPTHPVNVLGHLPTNSHECVETLKRTGVIIQQNVAYEYQVQFNNEKEPHTPSVDKVVYDEPVFVNNKELIIRQNEAYEEQVPLDCKKPTPSVDMAVYDEPVVTNKLDHAVTTKGLIIQPNLAYK